MATPTWTQTPEEIADEIQEQYLFLGDEEQLRDMIVDAINDERAVARYYMTQMGRWWKKYRQRPRKAK